jgi:hypothetical protein
VFRFGSRRWHRALLWWCSVSCAPACIPFPRREGSASMFQRGCPFSGPKSSGLDSLHFIRYSQTEKPNFARGTF